MVDGREEDRRRKAGYALAGQTVGLLEGGTQLAESCYHPRGWGHGENKENLIIIMPLSYEDENKIVTTVVKLRINVQRISLQARRLLPNQSQGLADTPPARRGCPMSRFRIVG